MKRGDKGYWAWRKNTGRPKNLKSPKQLWQAAVEYFDWCDNNPFKMQDFIRGGDAAGTIIELDKMRPYTWMGLEMWLRDNMLIAKLDDYRANKDNRYPEFADTLSHIEQIIRDQKFSGAAAGFFNANIISRDLGLTDKTQNTITVEQPLFPDVD